MRVSNEKVVVKGDQCGQSPQSGPGVGTVGLAGLGVLEKKGSHRALKLNSGVVMVKATPALYLEKAEQDSSNGLLPFIRRVRGASDQRGGFWAFVGSAQSWT